MPPRASRRSTRAGQPSSTTPGSKSPSDDLNNDPNSPTTPEDKAQDESRARRGKTREESNHRSEDKSTSRSSKHGKIPLLAMRESRELTVRLEQLLHQLLPKTRALPPLKKTKSPASPTVSAMNQVYIHPLLQWLCVFLTALPTDR